MYEGRPHELLEAAPLATASAGGPSASDASTVHRSATATTTRGFKGRVESGAHGVGDAIRVQPSGLESRVRAIVGRRAAVTFRAGQSVSIRLEDVIDISRGDLLATRLRRRAW